MTDSLTRRFGRPTLEEAVRLKAAILEAAFQAMLRNGIAGTSVDLVAQEAGVTKRTIYRHFAVKSDLVDATVEYEIARIEEAAHSPESTAGSPLEVLRYHALRLLENLTDPRFVRFLSFLMFESMADEHLAARLHGWSKRGRAPFAKLVGDAIVSGCLQGEASTLTLLLMDLLFAGPMDRIRMGDQPDQVFGGTTREAYFELRWNIFLSEAGARRVP